MGALGRTDFDCGEIQPSDGVGGDGGGYGGLLPVSVGVVDQDPGYSETYTDYQEPQYLAGFRLRSKDYNNIWRTVTFAVEMWERPWMVEDSRNSLRMSILPEAPAHLLLRSLPLWTVQTCKT